MTRPASIPDRSALRVLMRDLKAISMGFHVSIINVIGCFVLNGYILSRNRPGFKQYDFTHGTMLIYFYRAIELRQFIDFNQDHIHDESC